MSNDGAHIIVIGNEKGGSGKSTTAMHLIVGFLRQGHSVASIDLDVRQRTLTRYLENRGAYIEAAGIDLPMPEHVAAEASSNKDLNAAEAEEEEHLQGLIDRLRPAHDVLVIDTPGNDTNLGRLGHRFADTLITPLNDSYVDLDVLARVEAGDQSISGPSHYAEMVWAQKLKRAKRKRIPMDWIVMRNRLSNLHAHNKQSMADSLSELSRRIGFRTIPGFGERVVYRELFLKGLTMMDLREADVANGLNLSHVAGRQEVRTLLEFIRLS